MPANSYRTWGRSKLARSRSRVFNLKCQKSYNSYKPTPFFFKGMTSLHWACSRGHVEAAKVLLDFQAHLNQMELSDDKYTPLDYALLENHEKVAQFLIEQGALSIRGIQDLAAVKIQAVFRGYRLRKTFSERRKLMIEHEKLMKEACKKKKSVEENFQITGELNQSDKDYKNYNFDVLEKHKNFICSGR